MTPIYKHPAHITSDGKQTSRVFHADQPGRIVATFQGPDHVEDSEEFCRLANLASAEPENLPEDEPPVEFTDMKLATAHGARNAMPGSSYPVAWWHAASRADREEFLEAIGGVSQSINGDKFNWSVMPG